MLVVALICAEGVAGAQTDPPPEETGGWWIVPSLRTSGVREDNLQITDESRAIGSFLRVTPSFEARFQRPLRSFVGAYTFDSEVYARRLRGLGNVFARRVGGINFDGNLTPGTTFFSRARYMSTRRPEEVLDDTGLVPGQRRTTSYLAEAGLGRDFTPRTNGRLTYMFSLEDYGRPTDSRPSARSAQHSATATVSVRRSDRTSVAVESTGKMLIGDDLTTRAVARGVFWASTVGVRLTHSITPRVTAIVLAGPRMSQALPEVVSPTGRTPFEWKVSPEVLASLTYRTTAQRMSVSYARTAFLGLGASGFINTEGLEARAMLTLAHRLRVSVRPAVYRNSLSGLRSKSYRVDGTAVYDVSRWMTLEAAYLFKRQDRGLSLVDFDVDSRGRPRTRSSIIFGATVRKPIRVKVK